MGWLNLEESSSPSELFGRGGFEPEREGIKPDMYQTLGSPELSIIVRSFDCLVIEVQVVLPLLDQ